MKKASKINFPEDFLLIKEVSVKLMKGERGEPGPPGVVSLIIFCYYWPLQLCMVLFSDHDSF